MTYQMVWKLFPLKLPICTNSCLKFFTPISSFWDISNDVFIEIVLDQADAELRSQTCPLQISVGRTCDINAVFHVNNTIKTTKFHVLVVYFISIYLKSIVSIKLQIE